MLTKYLRAAMSGAQYELSDEAGHYAHIPGFEGVWADGVSLEECGSELEEVLEEWLLFRLSRQLPVPIADESSSSPHSKSQSDPTPNRWGSQIRARSIGAPSRKGGVAFLNAAPPARISTGTIPSDTRSSY